MQVRCYNDSTAKVTDIKMLYLILKEGKQTGYFKINGGVMDISKHHYPLRGEWSEMQKLKHF